MSSVGCHTRQGQKVDDSWAINPSYITMVGVVVELKTTKSTIEKALWSNHRDE